MKTRVGRHMDMSRLSAAVKRPGIDTRCWVSLAVALGDSVVDEKHGVFVDVQLVPTEEEYTARVSALYAGSGFGIYRKILKDDELVILVPSGEAAEGPVVVSQLHSAVDLPPQLAIDNPDDLIIVVEPEKNLRIAVSGAGGVVIETTGGDVTVTTGGGKALIDSGGGPVFLGADNLVSPDGVVHGTGIDPFTGAAYFALGNTSAIVHAKK